eukprot:m.41874 g.41874  ORF g.41874 m.41874 type:complete len:135 (+) comp10467_c0_seq2:515-919(+)
MAIEKRNEQTKVADYASEIMALSDENLRLKKELKDLSEELISQHEQQVTNLKKEHGVKVHQLERTIKNMKTELTTVKRQHDAEMESTKRAYTKKFAELASRTIQTPDVYKKKILALKKAHAMQMAKLRHKRGSK